MRTLLALAVVIAPAAANAQSMMVVGGGAIPNVIHMGTPIQLETRDELSTEHKALKVGQQIEMDVVQPVMLNNQVAIPAGSRAVGEVTTVRNKGMWGKSGGITARVLYVEANGRQIRLNGTFNDRGETGTAGVIASVAFVPVAGFFVTGTSAKIAPGTHVTAFIGEEVSVEFATTSTAAVASPAAVQPTLTNASAMSAREAGRQAAQAQMAAGH